MKETLLNVSEAVDRYSLLLVQISATALVSSLMISGAIVAGRAIQPLEKPTQRVAETTANIGKIGLAGLLASGVFYVGA